MSINPKSQVKGAVKPDALARVIENNLKVWSDELTDGITQDIIDVANETVAELEGTSPQRTGDYATSWAVSEVKTGGHIDSVVHNVEHYRLTHLLEKGHALRNGGRARATVHIATAEANAIDKLEKKIEERAAK